MYELGYDVTATKSSVNRNFPAPSQSHGTITYMCPWLPETSLCGAPDCIYQVLHSTGTFSSQIFYLAVFLSYDSFLLENAIHGCVGW